jgi:hypothetical protein
MEMDWNGTPWQEDIFDDNEDMLVVRSAILTPNEVLTMSLFLALFLTTYY